VSLRRRAALRLRPAAAKIGTPMLDALFHAAALAYALAWIARPYAPRSSRGLLGAGVALHLAASAGRGWMIGFLPLTNKFESFSAAALCIAIVAFVGWGAGRAYDLMLLGAGLAAFAAALSFPTELGFPPPLMRTVWYPIHVPLSFFAYALWIAAGAASTVWLVRPDPDALRRIDRLALQGFALWSLSMIAGGLWGVVAWGAYFLWDPKVVWSVILWFHYATFIHVRLTPSLASREWVRPVLALVGVLWVLVAYVGTSFLFGVSSHAF
jgi:ABC-type transport system involved in cytochrome c biogenesis permease subunit